MTTEYKTAQFTSRFNPMLTQHQAMVTFAWDNESVSFDPGVYGEPPKVSAIALSPEEAVVRLRANLSRFADDLDRLQKEVRAVLSALDSGNGP